MPTMADVDYFFENDVANILRDTDNAKRVLMGQSVQIDVVRVLFKTFGNEILNRFVEQGWSAYWDWDNHLLTEDNSKPTKTLLIRFARKSSEPEPVPADSKPSGLHEMGGVRIHKSRLYIIVAFVVLMLGMVYTVLGTLGFVPLYWGAR